jgi:peptide/nickel transport system ATP-binding protein
MLDAAGLSYRYAKRGPWIFDDLHLRIAPGEIVGMSGPSGRGKSTLAKVLTGYLPAVRGDIQVDEQPLTSQGPCPVQLLFQHPELAVNPRWKISKILREAGEASSGLLQDLGIEAAWLDRYPHELSGGELQRVCLARALGENTRYLICDEITSMLDAISQAHIWKIALHLVRSRGLGLLVISHHQTLIAKLCHRKFTYFEAQSESHGP